MNSLHLRCVACIATAASLLVLALTVLAVSAEAQTIVTGQIRSDTGAPLPSASVQLWLADDSSLVRNALSDAQGNFVLRPVIHGVYVMHISRLGYEDYRSEPMSVAANSTIQVGPFILEARAVQLEGLVVTADNPLYQQRGDRMLIDVEGSPTSAGSSALQVLEQAPGVVVNQVSKTISLRGRHGVRVLIDGKPSHIPADGLTQYLAGVSADNIKRIEVIHSPPASLDAEGNSGYINIVMKRRPQDGMNGSGSLAGGYGGGEVGNGSVNLNYRRDRLTLFGSYSFLWDGQTQFSRGFRSVANPEGVSETADASSRDPVQRNHDVRLGMEYEVNEGTTIGGTAAAYDNHWSMNALSESSRHHNGSTTVRRTSDNEEVNHWQHAMASLYIQQKLGGGMLRTDLDYLRYSNHNPTTYLNASTDAVSGDVTRQRLVSDKRTPLQILVANADYSWSRDQWALSMGAKGAFSRFTNETSLEGAGQQKWISDAGFGSTSWLREDVLAVYGSADYTPREETTLKMGLRYEHTSSNLDAETEQDLVARRFGSFFPSLALSHQLGERRTIGASYTRRITRPSFRVMAPFLYFIEPSTFFSGNAALQPAIINTLGLDGTYGSVTASIQYAWEDSTIGNSQRLLPGHDILMLAAKNFSATRSAMVLVSAPVRVTPWWKTQNSVMAGRQEVDEFDGTMSVTRNSRMLQLTSTQSFDLPSDFSLEATGSYQQMGAIGDMHFDPFWGANLALQKELRSGARVGLSLRDVFDSVEYMTRAGSLGDPLYTERYRDFSHPILTVTYSRRFGTGTAASRRDAASAEENGRI